MFPPRESVDRVSFSKRTHRVRLGPRGRRGTSECGSVPTAGTHRGRRRCPVGCNRLEPQV